MMVLDVMFAIEIQDLKREIKCMVVEIAIGIVVNNVA